MSRFNASNETGPQSRDVGLCVAFTGSSFRTEADRFWSDDAGFPFQSQDLSRSQNSRAACDHGHGQSILSCHSRACESFKPTNYTKGIRSVGNSSRDGVARRSVVRQRRSTGAAESLYHCLKSARVLVRLDHGAGLVEQADDRGLRTREEFRVTDRVTDCVRFFKPQ